MQNLAVAANVPADNNTTKYRILFYRTKYVSTNLVGPNIVRVFLPLPEDGNRSSFRNAVFYSYLEFRIMDKVQKPSDSE
jgi:hypothetical protein